MPPTARRARSRRSRRSRGRAPSRTAAVPRARARRRQISPASKRLFAQLSAQRVDVDAAVAREDDARAQEERAFHQAVARDVDPETGERAGRHQAQRDQQRAAVRDRREREQPLEVALARAQQRADDGGGDAERQEHGPDGVHVRAEHAEERRPEHARDGVQPELHHDAGEQHAQRRRRDGVRVVEPEVERHDRALDEKSDGDQRERQRREGVGAVARTPPARARPASC